MKHFLPTFVFQPLNNINNRLSMRMQTQLRVLSFMHMPFYVSLAKIISNRRALKNLVTT